MLIIKAKYLEKKCFSDKNSLKCSKNNCKNQLNKKSHFNIRYNYFKLKNHKQSQNKWKFVL
jgi:hypothetical protein